MLVQACIVFCLSALGLVLAPWLGLSREVAVFGQVAGLGIGLWLAVFAPLWVGWSRAGDPRRQARLAERRRPALQGRLITLADRLNGASPSESPAILALLAQRTQARARGLRAGELHPVWPVALTASPIPLLLLTTLLMGLFSPGGLSRLASYWAGAVGADQLQEHLDAADALDRARVGDLVLEYTYPSYTRLEPREVPNSTGDAHGPPGTRVRVRVRSAEPVEAAELFAYGEPTEATELIDARVVSGAFTIGSTDGTWYLLLHRGGGEQQTRDFEIQVEPDLPPVVLVDAPPRIEVPVDAIVELPWHARDDYGLRRVVLIIDGEEGREIRKLVDSPPEASGILRFTPEQLGMSPGMRARIQIGAWDNNGWSGDQLGVSEPAIQIIVGEPDDQSQLSLEEREELRDVLVDLLAAQLLQAWPPGRTNADVLAYGEAFDALYAPLRELKLDRPSLGRDRFVGRLLHLVQTAGVDFVVHTQINFDPDLRTSGVRLEQLTRAGELRERAITHNEQAIIMLDRYLARDALAAMVERAGEAAQIGDSLASLAQDGAGVSELQLGLDRVARATEELRVESSRMSTGSLRDLVERRTAEFDRLRGEIGAQLQSRDLADAQKLTGRLSRQITELFEELQYRLRRLDEEDEELTDLIKELLRKLRANEREQRVLQQDVRKIREQGDERGTAEAEDLWAKVERLAERASDQGDRLLQGIPEGRGPFYTRELVASAVRSTHRLADTARARDLRKALTDVDDALMAWTRTYRRVDEHKLRPVLSRLEEAQRILQRLIIESESVPRDVALKAMELQTEQTRLAEQRDEIERTTQEVIPQLPIEPIGMEEALRSAAESMQSARRDLQSGQPMPAEGAQGQAAEYVKEARQALEDVLDQMSSGRSGGDSDSGSSRNDDEQSAEPLDLDSGLTINSPELNLEDEFDLDAFQRDVLRGMQGDVPESYRALKRRYYEELMTQ